MHEQIVQEFVLNTPQAIVLSVMANETWCLWGRGTGKTQGVIAPWLLHKVEVMPRSNGGLIGQSFTDLENKILQPLFTALQMLGYEKDEHFVYGKRPLDTWEKPLTPIIDYSRVLTFPNGTTVELISLHEKGSANAKSLQWLIADEAKLLNDQRLRGEVFPILRGQVKHFGASPWYGAKLLVTDKLSPSIQWILAKKKLMDADLVNSILYYQLQVNGWRMELQESGGKAARQLQKKIDRAERMLAVLRKGCVMYSEASAKENMVNLSPDFFDNMERSLTAYEFAVAILNEDPTRVENGFYPDRGEEHLYDDDWGEDQSDALGVVFDNQWSISPLVAFQLNDRVVPGVRGLAFLSAHYVLHPLGLKHVVDDFCAHYSGRPTKKIYLFYDHTMNARRNMNVMVWEEVKGYFVANGWKVTPIYTGKAPNQDDKYRRMKVHLQGIGPFPIRIHRDACATMVLSMDQTPALTSGDETKKDKSSERNRNFPQEQATHFSDVFDMAWWAVCEAALWPARSNEEGWGVVTR